MNLLEIVSTGDLNQVREFFDDTEKLSQLNDKNIKGLSPLMIASIRGYTEIVELLLEKGANVFTRNKNRPGFSSLHYAVAFNRSEIVKLLVRRIKSSASLKARSYNLSENDFRNSMPFYLQSFQQHGTERVEDKNGNINFMYNLLINGINSWKDKGGYTPLHIAAEFELYEIVKELLSAGIDPNIEDDNGDAPVVRSIYNGNMDIFLELINAGADPNLACSKIPSEFIRETKTIKLMNTQKYLKTYMPTFQTLIRREIHTNKIDITCLPFLVRSV